jgi:two-component system response regulator HydG
LLSLHKYRLELVSSLLNLSLLYERTRKWDAAKVEAQKAVDLADSLGIEQLCRRARRQLESVLANTPHVLNKPEVFHGMVHTSTQMRQAIARIKIVAPVDEPVLLLGETGTGKELAAKAIHLESKRSTMPFIPFNCSSLSRELVESRLFGHRRGAFTGADRDHLGVIRAAAGGTVFLDEIGDLSLDAQAALLRFLQSGEVQPLGFNSPVKVDVRIIAATNHNLRQESEAGRFRTDLYYRLNVATVTLPQLWSRKDDIRLLASHFADIYSQQFRQPIPTLGEAELKELLEYEWPGNVRQLENYMKRRILFGESEAVDPDGPVPAGELNPLPQASDDLVWRLLEEAEKERLLNQVLIRTQGNITHAARHLGISRRTIQRMRRGKKIPPS